MTFPALELRSTLSEVLGHLLSPDQDQRRLAEQQLKALQVTEEFGVLLTELTLSEDQPVALRQMTAVLLRQYVDVHWNSGAEKYEPPETTPEAKAAIRKMLPEGLKESISKVRSSLAYTISTIGHWDWPEDWPELFDLLMAALQSHNEFAVQGAVRVLKEFVRDISGSQITDVAPVILPDMYRIFMEMDAFTVRTRTRAIEIFTTMANVICTMADTNKSLSQSLLGPILPTFTEALVTALHVPDHSHVTDAGLKTEVLKALVVLLKNCSKSMTPYLSHVIPAVWKTLTVCAAKYVAEIVNHSDSGEEELVDSDGEVLGFENLVFAIFEIVQSLVEVPRYRESVRGGLPDLIYYIVLYMQITEDQCEKWSENPDQFVEEEDEHTYAFSVRISAQDLLLTLSEEFEDECCVALIQTIERHVTEAEQQKHSGSRHWWKVHEATMLALGSMKEVIEGQVKAGKVKFDLENYLQNVVLANLANPASPYLFGRCLWLGSRFPSQMPASALPQFLEANVRGLQEDQLSVVRISAVRSIRGFCAFLGRRGEAERRAFLAPVLPAVMDALINMSSAFNRSSDVLGLILENMVVVLGCDKDFTLSCEPKVSPLIIAIFLKYSSDPSVVNLVMDVISVLCRNERCLQPLQERLVPTLVSILAAEENTVELGLKAAALDAMETLVRATQPRPLKSEVGAWTRTPPPRIPLSELLMSSAFPAVVQCTLRSDDNSILQIFANIWRALALVFGISSSTVQEPLSNMLLHPAEERSWGFSSAGDTLRTTKTSGGECVRAYISTAPDQICHFRDAEGKTGLWYMVQVAEHLLNPVGSEFSATFVGRLVTTLIQKTGDRLGENLELLLKAVLSKLQGSQTLSVVQSLLMVFAQLVHTQLNALLSFLTSVPGPTGESALAFVLTKWVSVHHVVYGSYENRVSIVALAKLLQHGVNTNDTRLQDITVAGDMIIQTGPTRAATRSQTKSQPVEYTKIPVLVKIFKLIVSELHTMNEILASSQRDESEGETDDDEWADEDPNEHDTSREGASHKMVDLSRVLADPRLKVDDGLDEDEEDEEDLDVLSDPLYQLNLNHYLTEFLTQFCKQPYFPTHFAQHLTTPELRVLASIGAQI